jgi:hypothetical protein
MQGDEKTKKIMVREGLQKKYPSHTHTHPPFSRSVPFCPSLVVVTCSGHSSEPHGPHTRWGVRQSSSFSLLVSSSEGGSKHLPKGISARPPVQLAQKRPPQKRQWWRRVMMSSKRELHCI